MSTVSLTLEEVGDGFVKLKARLTSGNATGRNADLRTIKKVFISYNHSALNAPGKYQVTNLGGTLSQPADDILTKFSGYMNNGTWVPPAEVSIFLFSDDVYSTDPDGYGRVPIHFSNGYQVKFICEVFGTNAAGQTTRIASNQVTAVPVGRPSPPVITACTPLTDVSFKLTVAAPTDDGGAPIDSIIAYLSIPNTQVAGQSKYETRDLINNRFDFLTKRFDFPTQITWNNPARTSFDILFDGSAGFTDASFGVLPDTLYNIYLIYTNNGGGISNDSNIFVGYPSDKPGQPTVTTLIPGDRNVRINFTPPANSFFSYIKGLVVTDISGNATNYFKNTATGFVTVSDLISINNNTANIVMDPTLTYNFTVTGLVNNVSYDRKFYLVNSFGTGLISAQFTLIAQAPPSDVQNLTITQANSLNNVFTNSAYPLTVKSYINSSLIDAVPINVTFNDPTDNWPSTRQSGINYYYETNIVEVDCSASAMSVAMKRFYGQGGTSVSAVPNEITMDASTVYYELNRCITAIDNVNTGVADWTTYPDASKNIFITGVIPPLSLSTNQTILALNEYYNIMAFKKYLLNDISFNTIVDVPGPNNSIVVSGLSNEIIYVPAGTFIKIQVSPVIEIVGSNSKLMPNSPMTVQTVVKTNRLDAPTISYTSSSRQIAVTIIEPIFTYGYNIGTNYVLKLNGSNVQNIAVASGVPSNIFIANKTHTYSGLTNGTNYNLDVTLSYPGTPQIDKSSSAANIVTNGVPNAPVLSSITPLFNPATPGTISVTFPAVTNFDGATFNSYEFRLINTTNLSEGLFDGSTQSVISNATYTSSTVTGTTATCSAIPAGNGNSYYFIGRVLATAAGGVSVNSNWARTQTFTVSGAPSGTFVAPTITQNNDFINVQWTAPNDDGFGTNNGSNINDYYLLIYDNTSNLLSSSYSLQTRYNDYNIPKNSSPTNLGLVNGTSYKFAVRAISRNGLSLDGTLSSPIMMQASVAFPANTTPTIDNSGVNRIVSVPLNLNGSTINQIAIMYTTTANGLGTTFNATVHANAFGVPASGVSTASNIYYVRSNTSSTVVTTVSHSSVTNRLTVDLGPVLSALNAGAVTIAHVVFVINDSTGNMILTQI